AESAGSDGSIALRARDRPGLVGDPTDRFACAVLFAPGEWLVLCKSEGELRAGVDLELGVHAREVDLDGLGADEQLSRHLAVGEAGSDEAGHGLLLGSEPRRVTLTPLGRRQTTGSQLLLAPVEEGASPERQEDLLAGARLLGRPS